MDIYVIMYVLCLGVSVCTHVLCVCKCVCVSVSVVVIKQHNYKQLGK